MPNSHPCSQCERRRRSELGEKLQGLELLGEGRRADEPMLTVGSDRIESNRIQNQIDRIVSRNSIVGSYRADAHRITSNARFLPVWP